MWYDKFTVSKKYVVLTGASGGIGLAISRTFLEAGAFLVTINRRDDIDWHGLDLEFPETMKHHLCDLADRYAVENLANELVNRYAVIDILINNACPNNIASKKDYDFDVLEKIRKVGLDAPYILCGIIAPHMSKNGKGSIINITSINAEAAWPDNPAYVTVKSGLKMLTKAVALDFGANNVRANNVCPGYIHTAMTDSSFSDPEKHKARSDRTMLGRWGLPEEVANICLFLASDASSYITGTDIIADGGWLAKGL